MRLDGLFITAAILGYPRVGGKANDIAKFSLIRVCVCVCVCVCTQSCLIFEIPWTVIHKAPLCMGFSRQEYWSGLPFPLPGDLPHARIKPSVPTTAGRVFIIESPGKQILAINPQPRRHK